MPDWVTNPDHRAVVAALTALRVSAGLTQRALATTMGMDHTIVAKIEMGQRRVTVVDLMDWCRAVGADPAAVVQKLADAQA